MSHIVGCITEALDPRLLPIALVICAIGSLTIARMLARAAAGRGVAGRVDNDAAGRAAREAARFRWFAEAAFEGLFLVDRGVVSDVNPALCEMLRRDPAEVVGATLLSFVAPESRAAFGGLLHLDRCATELALIDGAGERVDVDVLVRALAPGDGSRKVVAVRDATERKRAERRVAERRIQELRQIDPLTGLVNRSCLTDQLGHALAEARRTDGSVAVLCLDLDRFKTVNDLMGHQDGDRLLIEVANRLRAAAGESGAVTRLSGDAFSVVWPFAGDEATVKEFASGLARRLSAPYIIDGNKVEISASIGIALYPSGAATAETLLMQADLALDRAKRDGRNCHRFFDAAMDARLREQRAMEHDLRQALTNGELYLDYQPVYNGSRLELTGYEALIRWRHPRLGAVPPSVFIPVAEACGAILPIGRWVLETACAQAASWSEPLGISVNLSPAQFNNLDLPDEIADIVARTGLQPARLELEVTEGVLIDDTDRAHAVLSAIKAQGVRIALDDFGTGYSSLSYLRRFRVDRLKIDRSFVKEIGVDPDADAIVRAIVAMSKRLRMEVTAEGIETEQQLTLLRALRCDHLQGFCSDGPAGARGCAPTRIGDCRRLTAGSDFRLPRLGTRL